MNTNSQTNPNILVDPEGNEYDPLLTDYVEHIARTWTARCPEDELQWEWFDIIVRLVVWIVPSDELDHYLNAVCAVPPHIPREKFDASQAELPDPDMRYYSPAAERSKRIDHILTLGYSDYSWEFTTKSLRFLCAPIDDFNEPPIVVLSTWPTRRPEVLACARTWRPPPRRSLT